MNNILKPVLLIISLLVFTPLSAPSFANEPSQEQRMIDHCQKRHPEMTVDQCRTMYQNMKNMTPEQRVERCKRNHPELTAEACQKKYGGST
ncbi:hypothetical protein MCEREM21_00682 [Burkholderiaceae bacterium]|jgi:hypothetical protein